MKAEYVEPIKTPRTFEEATRAMSAALRSALGYGPPVRVLALGMAKTVLECGRDTKAGLVWTSSYNSGIGNIKAGPDYVGMFTAYPCNEVLQAGVVWFDPRGRLNRRGGEVIAEKWEAAPWHPQCRFRSYANHFDGAHSYVDFVAGGRWRDAWKELLEGDPYDYVMALHAKGYFTADPLVYVKAVKSLHAEFTKKLEGVSVPPAEIPDCDEISCLLAPQPWNVAAVRAHGQALAMESTFDNLDALRRESHREMLADDDEPREVRDTEPPSDNAPTDRPPPESA
jgi:hypothetical protein